MPAQVSPRRPSRPTPSASSATPSRPANGARSSRSKTSDTDFAREMQRLSIRADQAMVAKLDTVFSEAERVHNAALEEAAARHAEVRQSAIIAREKYDILLRYEAAKKTQHELHELDQLRKRQSAMEHALDQQEIADSQQAAADLKRRTKILEVAKSVKEEARRELEAQQMAMKKADQDLQNAKSQHDERVRQQQAQALQQQQQQQQAAQTRSSQPQPSPQNPPTPKEHSQPQQAAKSKPFQSPTEVRSKSGTAVPVEYGSSHLARHEEYLSIHKFLKHYRALVMAEAKQNQAVKSEIGDTRRLIKQTVGQITSGDNTANKPHIAKIIAILGKARRLDNEARVDIRKFIISGASSPALSTAAEEDPMVSIYFIYFFNIFAKAVINQFLGEASVKPKAADAIGIVAVSTFAQEGLRWSGRTVIDILLAKFHFLCPVLFGIRGHERTAEGKIQLGWAREEKDGPFVSEQSHFDRMTALSAGWASMSLRKFNKSRLSNPLPSFHYWVALARVTSTPQKDISDTHCVILKGLIENFEQRFYDTFGQSAVAALKLALFTFPTMAESAGHKSSTVGALKALQERVVRDLKTH
ncbi:MAG: hypothetical protein M1814_004146 [Vezdaea aestivalis]|nr:MAG: hypothetical protein M1814_004146 [Vezdaea aestivalis]